MRVESTEGEGKQNRGRVSLRQGGGSVWKAVVLRALGIGAVACEVRAAGTGCACAGSRVPWHRATRTAEEHLCVGAHERDQDLMGAPEHLALNKTGNKTASPAAFAASTSFFQRRFNSLQMAGSYVQRTEKDAEAGRNGHRKTRPAGACFLVLAWSPYLCGGSRRQPLEDLVLVSADVLGRPRHQDREIDVHWRCPAREIFNGHVDFGPILKRVALCSAAPACRCGQ